ncbi:hypothetical protein A8713_20535 [Streptomyces sp. SAT1]|uniref:DUF6507 family protein n=1 Tax=Streptomyces sp. SAT1 TaxID=1849967 RepID=UPI0007DD2116|nr:DUF6507 family protein [Streptomyces sp. SAT1]ANH93250.1 hypothetical protein A8713_20535 [Streptomyces sp. SAT1]
MTGWDISPVGVQAALTTTGEAGGDLDRAATTLLNDLMSAASSAGTVVPGGQFSGPLVGPVAPGRSRVPTGPVAEALAQYLSERQKKLAFMARRTAESVQGAAEATRAYVHGDLEMAAEAQRNALKPPRIDMPGTGGKNGGGA